MEKPCAIPPCSLRIGLFHFFLFPFHFLAELVLFTFSFFLSTSPS